MRVLQRAGHGYKKSYATHSLVHGLALARLLCRTLVLPGFYVRFGRRTSNEAAFAEAAGTTFIVEMAMQLVFVADVRATLCPTEPTRRCRGATVTH